MKSKFTLCVVLVGLVAVGGPVYAELCTIDDVPAATLLLPYFEVDINDDDEDGVLNCADPDDRGVTTLFSVNNASAAAQLVHVVLWTDWTVPTLDFDVYLTGFDVQTMNVCDIFRGNLPVTADLDRDPTDTISPSPTNAWEFDFPDAGCDKFPFVNPELNSTQIAHIRAAHTGQASPILDGPCAGEDYDDGIARGYITVDVVRECSLLFPGQTGYFGAGGTGVATNDNVLWGNYHYVDAGNNFAQGETLVHIEADAALTENTVNDTFYSRFDIAGLDNREPLATTFAARYITADAFSGGTDLIVWREGGDPTTTDFQGYACSGRSPANPIPPWHPLQTEQVVIFDEEENPTEICIPTEDRISPPTGEAQFCFPLETQRVPVGEATPIPNGDDIAPADDIGGWIFLNLNYAITGEPGDPKQAWVTTTMSALGRFSTGMDAIQLDSACFTTAPGPELDLP